MFKRELLQNKIYAILLIVCTLPIIFLDGDATATVFMGMIAVPMFFAKENWIYQKEERTYGARASQGRCSLVHPRQEEADCSTIAAGELIVLLAKEGGTIAEVQRKINYDEEAKAVLQAYIDRGYGDVEARKWFKS